MKDIQSVLFGANLESQWAIPAKRKDAFPRIGAKSPEAAASADAEASKRRTKKYILKVKP